MTVMVEAFVDHFYDRIYTLDCATLTNDQKISLNQTIVKMRSMYSGKDEKIEDTSNSTGIKSVFFDSGFVINQIVMPISERSEMEIFTSCLKSKTGDE